MKVIEITFDLFNNIGSFLVQRHAIKALRLLYLYFTFFYSQFFLTLSKLDMLTKPFCIGLGHMRLYFLIFVLISSISVSVLAVCNKEAISFCNFNHGGKNPESFAIF